MPAEPQLKFSEAGEHWRTVPHWVDWIIDMGYLWPTETSRPRRIALISMPCDSAGAGLLTLGAMIRGLCLQDASELQLHVDSLLKHAKQYLQHCRNCDLQVCQPELKQCGCAERAEGRVKLVGVNHVYTISEASNPTDGKIACSRGSVTIFRSGDFISTLHLHGSLPLQLNDSLEPLPPAPYRLAIQGTSILTQNLKKSYSGLCLAGRSNGESATHEFMKSIRFRDNVSEYGLDELLSIQGWSPLKVSRVTYFNTRTQESDRLSAPPRLLVADGEAAFLTAINMSKFRESDIVGVINRVIDRDRLEGVGNKIHELHQWYQIDEDMMGMIPSSPMGISVVIMTRRE